VAGPAEGGGAALLERIGLALEQLHRLRVERAKARRLGDEIVGRDPHLDRSAELLAVGNDFYGTAPDGDPALERMFFQDAPTEDSLTNLSLALDDLRRLGEIDLRLNHPEH